MMLWHLHPKVFLLRNMNFLGTFSANNGMKERHTKGMRRGTGSPRLFCRNSCPFQAPEQTSSKRTKQISRTAAALTSFGLELHHGTKLGLSCVPGEIHFVFISHQNGLVAILRIPHAAAPA
ncbi:UNVERIFIED_CONTAM: hypothetical protein K2H54_049695 [Gekko kuhli]